MEIIDVKVKTMIIELQPKKTCLQILGVTEERITMWKIRQQKYSYQSLRDQGVGIQRRRRVHFLLFPNKLTIKLVV